MLEYQSLLEFGLELALLPLGLEEPVLQVLHPLADLLPHPRTRKLAVGNRKVEAYFPFTPLHRLLVLDLLHVGLDVFVIELFCRLGTSFLRRPLLFLRTFDYFFLLFLLLLLLLLLLLPLLLGFHFHAHSFLRRGSFLLGRFAAEHADQPQAPFVRLLLSVFFLAFDVIRLLLDQLLLAGLEELLARAIEEPDPFVRRLRILALDEFGEQGALEELAQKLLPLVGLLQPLDVIELLETFSLCVFPFFGLFDEVGGVIPHQGDHQFQEHVSH